METSHPARERMRFQQSQAHNPAPVRDDGFAYDIPTGAEDNRASPHSQPGWQLWGMMVGFMVAGAAILIFLSFQTI